MKRAQLTILLCALGLLASVLLAQETAPPPTEDESAGAEEVRAIPVANPPVGVTTVPQAAKPLVHPSGGSGAAGTPVSTLADVRRIYIAPLTGGRGRDALRDLIIASVSATHEFVVTEYEERADAVLKGAADDDVFNEHFNTTDSTSVHGTLGLYGSAVKGAGRGPGGYGSESASEHSSTRAEERKHEAYAAVHLCNKDGDVIWSTTQESPGAKFRGAAADVAAKVARQLVIDLEKAKRKEFETEITTPNTQTPGSPTKGKR